MHEAGELHLKLELEALYVTRLSFGPPAAIHFVQLSFSFLIFHGPSER